jgi:hypothetical protein
MFRAVLSAALALLLPAAALAQTQAALVVGATVAPRCLFSVRDAGSAHASVTASCGSAGLRALRASAGGIETLQPSTSRRLRAGGDAVFVVSRTMAASADGRSVVVTLDF